MRRRVTQGASRASPRMTRRAPRPGTARRRGPGEVALEERAGDRGRKQGVAPDDPADAEDQVLGWAVLEQEPAGAAAQRLEDVVVALEGGEHQHPGPGGGSG